LLPRFLGRDALFFGVLSNAAADGKRLGVSAISQAGTGMGLTGRNQP
jgi:hypothetical protein